MKEGNQRLSEKALVERTGSETPLAPGHFSLSQTKAWEWRQCCMNVIRRQTLKLQTHNNAVGETVGDANVIEHDTVRRATNTKVKAGKDWMPE